MAAQLRKLETGLTRIGGRQHGAVTHAQLVALGFTRNHIAHRIASGTLVPVHRGVYLVGLGPPAPLAYQAAALLACGPCALLSRHTAGRLSRLPVPVNDGIAVTVVGRWRRSLDGVEVHSIDHLAEGELRRHAGLPLSSPSLTLLDLAGTLDTADLTHALNEARVQRIVTDKQLGTTLAAHPKRRGARALRRLLDSERGPRITRSEAERRALRVMRRHGIEPDASDHEIGPYRVDFWFEREQVSVEVDGYMARPRPRRAACDAQSQAHPDAPAGRESTSKRLRAVQTWKLARRAQLSVRRARPLRSR